jgi:membrane protein YdbS with pleckstrin-like domain
VPYPRKLLNQNEEVVLDLRPHWWFLVPRLALLALAIVLGVAALSWEEWAGAVVGVLVVAALVFFLLRLAVWATTNFVITTDRVIYRSGVLSKRGIEIPHDRINTVVFNQRLFERMIGAGDLEIQSAGETPSKFTDIRKPDVVQSEIYRQAEANENRKFDRIGAPPSGESGGGSLADELKKLDDLRQQGVLSEQEFQAQKAALLSRE